MTRTGQMKTKLMDVVDSLDALERTPTAFRWTPAMSAIWPKDYRPTMTGLLAMWEAMHEAAEYSSSQAASDDGWIEWGGGDCPVPPNTLVLVKGKNGIPGKNPQRAADFYWGLDNSYALITSYRVVAK